MSVDKEPTAPTLLAGNVLLVHQTLDQGKEPRLAGLQRRPALRASRPASHLDRHNVTGVIATVR